VTLKLRGRRQPHPQRTRPNPLAQGRRGDAAAGLPTRLLCARPRDATMQTSARSACLATALPAPGTSALRTGATAADGLQGPGLGGLSNWHRRTLAISSLIQGRVPALASGPGARHSLMELPQGSRRGSVQAAAQSGKTCPGLGWAPLQGPPRQQSRPRREPRPSGRQRGAQTTARCSF